ncbi:hypothetical protein IscW_ISCW004415 [Ixodes scapularis]|uniref:Uncharacterized protein n=1 Tax=Ixodes scapularis TaxID=6945 RepID=B7PJ75_IXOSC|nr:hypothetical protein IscW_ISCW004415 [Ixodes scapularis]|eukprot:XP_002407253.1 hypothetical protein IscW_ISCW004415 [Ixodes scapularis]
MHNHDNYVADVTIPESARVAVFAASNFVSTATSVDHLPARRLTAGRVSIASATARATT